LLKPFSLFFFLFFLNHLYGQDGLLWRIHPPESKNTWYLFGTMHTGNEKLRPVYNSVLTFLDSVDVLVLETDPDKLLQSSGLAKLKARKGNTLKDLLKEEDYTYLVQYFSDSIQIQPFIYNFFTPVMTWSVLQNSFFGSRNSIPLDLQLQKAGKEKKLSIIGLETAEEQMNSLQSISDKQAVEAIREMLYNQEKSKQTCNALLNMYVNEKTDSLLALTHESGNDKLNEHKFLTKRNKKMAKRINAMSKNQNYFIAIGALHLPGSKGVLHLLEKSGFKTERILLSKPL